MELPVPLNPPFIHDQGFCWRAGLPAELGWAMDSAKRPRISPLCLWEGERRLAPGHSAHAEIGRVGLGRHSFWIRTLYFSTSDNSDPNQNGRGYTVDLGELGQANVVERALVRRIAKPVPAPKLERPIRLGIVGLGQRGRLIASILKPMPGAVIAAVQDPLRHRVEGFVAAFGKDLPIRACATFEEIAGDPTLDGLVIASPDHLHEAQAVQALAAGKALFLEKPIAVTAAGAEAIRAMAQRMGLPVHVGFVLRYAPFCEAIREELSSAGIGEVIVVDLADHLGIDHGASYRRRWHRRSEWSGGLMVHKGCHDIDLVEWLLGQRIVNVSSMGGPGPFSRRPAPATHCSICRESATCRHRFTPYFTYVSKEEAEQLTAYDIDRCVFGLDQDIVEVQTVLMQLDGGARATLRIDMSSPGNGERRIRVLGEHGTIEGGLNEGHFEVTFNDGRTPYAVSVSAAGGDHGGGDSRSLVQFLQGVASGKTADNSLDDACRGIRVALAADLSARSGRHIDTV
jgi:predicted dehydrogenase